ncbi:MAG: DUF2147 domain-containing protein [Roseivivax sp.]|nr:DUF2147 domain-containing protein [Roseivivax sp.]
MRYLLGLAAAAVLSAGAALADPVEGVWKTQPDDNGHYGHITISMCGAEICGVIGKAYDGAGKELASENVGKQMIWAMQAEGGGQYKGGKIWAPDRNKTYNSRMALNGDTLKVEGCVLGICRGQTWTRVK